MRKLPWLIATSPILVLACAIAPEEWPREPFTVEGWKAASWEQRYLYYESLAASRLLDGATRERVIDLLGKPDGKNKPNNLAYLVRKRPLAICGYNCSDIRILDIRIGPDGKVSRYFIRGT